MLQKHISCEGSIILRIWSQMYSNHQPLLPSLIQDVTIPVYSLHYPLRGRRRRRSVSVERIWRTHQWNATRDYLHVTNIYLPPWFIIGSTHRGEYDGFWNNIPVLYWQIDNEHKYFSRHFFTHHDFLSLTAYSLLTLISVYVIGHRLNVCCRLSCEMSDGTLASCVISSGDRWCGTILSCLYVSTISGGCTMCID